MLTFANMANSDDVTKILELLEIVKHKVDAFESWRFGQSATIQLMKDQLSVVNKKIDDMDGKIENLQSTLNANTASLMEIEKALGGYKESYQEKRHNIERLDTRLDVVEEELAIEPPEDLKVPHFAD